MAKSAANRRRSPCPVACVLDLLGDKWTLLVVRDLFCGKTLFKDFIASPEGIATNILTTRLEHLVNHGFVEKHELEQTAGRYSYHLTAKGKSLRPLIEVLASWGLEHLPKTEARMKIQAPE